MCGGIHCNYVGKLNGKGFVGVERHDVGPTPTSPWPETIQTNIFRKTHDAASEQYLFEMFLEIQVK